MAVRRNNALYNVTSVVCYGTLNTYFNVEYHGAKNVPKKGPVLLLPKHQAMRDLIFEGLFTRYHCRRHANWVMKSVLPGVLGLLGGIKIKRPKDMRKIKDRAKRRQLLENAKGFNKKAMDYVEQLYTEGGIVVVHPEGARYPGEMGPFKREMFDFTRKVAETHGMQIPVIPLGIEYESYWMPRARVALRAGEPVDINNPDIENIIHSEIKRLSGL